ncbi:MAG: cupin domain-containing protein [Candidatus Bipolaricaulota bacterium]
MVLIRHASDVPVRAIDGGGARAVEKKVLLGTQDGVPNFVLRQFTLAPDGHSPEHAHAWEHEIYVLSGEGLAVTSAGTHPLAPGDAVFVPPLERHQFRNPGPTPFVFLCIVPREGDDG